jgi:hypothetical protein
MFLNYNNKTVRGTSPHERISRGDPSLLEQFRPYTERPRDLISISERVAQFL